MDLNVLHLIKNEVVYIKEEPMDFTEEHLMNEDDEKQVVKEDGDKQLVNEDGEKELEMDTSNERQALIGNSGQEMLNISEPTQQVIRTILKEENKEKVTLRKALQVFQIGLESDNLDHAISTWCNASAYQELIGEFYMLPSSIVQKLGDCGRYEEACSFGMEQLKVIEKLDDEKPTYLRYKIGSLLLKQKRFEEALEVCEDPTGYYGGQTSYFKDVKIFLRHAAEDGNLEATKFLIENKGTDDEICDDKSLMHCAVLGNNLEVVKFLVEEKGADVNAKNDDDQVPLHYAAEKGYLDIVKYLLEKGADFNSIDYWCRTSVHYAAKQSNLDIVELLVERGVSFSSCDEDLGTPLHYAAVGGCLDVVKYLVEKGTDVSVKNDDGQTPLCCAAEEGHLSVVKYLLEKGADVGARSNNARVPLRYAAERGHLDVVRYLLERGADVGAKVLLHDVAERGHFDVVKCLVEKGADVNAKGGFGQIPLHHAAVSGHLDVVKYLVEKGAGINARDRCDQVPLHAAARGHLDGHLDVVKYLVEKGADVSARDSDDRTSLYWAVYVDSLSTVRFLIEKSVSDDQLRDFINQRTKEGTTALDLAVKAGNENIIRILGQALQKAPCTSIEDISIVCPSSINFDNPP